MVTIKTSTSSSSSSSSLSSSKMIEHGLESEVASTLALLAAKNNKDGKEEEGVHDMHAPPRDRTNTSTKTTRFNAPPFSPPLSGMKQHQNSGQFSGTGPSPSNEHEHKHKHKHKHKHSHKHKHLHERESKSAVRQRHPPKDKDDDVPIVNVVDQQQQQQQQQQQMQQQHPNPNMNIEEDVKNAVTIGALIKETVLRKLNRPEDMVKRNMFAIEGKSIKFPVKLMYLLDECEEFHSTISWSHDGKSFLIYNPDALEEKVLPVIFKEAKISSFLRKLTRWGFGKKCLALGMRFSQKKFRRGNYSMCIDINCSSKPAANSFIRVAPRTHSQIWESPSPYAYSTGSASGSVGGLINGTNASSSSSSSTAVPESAIAASSRRSCHTIGFPEDTAVAGRSRIDPSSSKIADDGMMDTTESVRHLREMQTICERPFLGGMVGPSPPLPPATSNLLLNDFNQRGRSAGGGANDRLLSDALLRARDQVIVNSIIRRALDEEQARAIQAIQCVSRESASLYNHYGVSLPQQNDLARLIEQERQQQQLDQLQLLANNTIGSSDANLRNLLPQKDVLLSSVLRRASQNLREQQGGNDVSSLLNQEGLLSNSSSSNSALEAHLPDSLDSHAFEERGRIHSQIMSTALKGLLSTPQQDESAARVPMRGLFLP